MLENLLRIPNILHTGDTMAVADPRSLAVDPEAATCGDGRFAVAGQYGQRVILGRDKYGMNKLFFALDRRRGVLAANYFSDLTAAGVGFDAIYAVPAGCLTTIDMSRGTLALHRYHDLPRFAGSAPDPVAVLQTARQRLTDWFGELARSGTGPVAVCLSGGLDSALIAALAARHLPDQVTAYTYAFDDDSGEAGPDADGAARLANWLGIPHRLVAADTDNVLRAVPAALRHGQDWRDFNVHCAIVNELLAKAIAADEQASHVLTGDLMNEIVGDYLPIAYRGRQFYPLPAVSSERLRVSLVRGLQCGDREVGVFAAHHLIVHQPYSVICDDLLTVPGTLTKPQISRALAGDLLPAWAYQRPKARAQIGAPHASTGVLPLLVDAGRCDQVLEDEFLDAIGAPAPQRLNGRIRGGVYRFPNRFPLED